MLPVHQWADGQVTSLLLIPLQAMQVAVSRECLPASRHMLLHIWAGAAYRQDGIAPAHHVLCRQAGEGGVADLAEELLFQLVGPPLVGRQVCRQVSNVSTLQQHLH